MEIYCIVFNLTLLHNYFNTVHNYSLILRNYFISLHNFFAKCVQFTKLRSANMTKKVIHYTMGLSAV